MKTSPKFILRLIEESGIGFNNARNKPEIKERISPYYNEALLDELINLNKEAAAKFQEFERLHGEQLEASVNLEKFYEKEEHHYSVFRKGAKRKYSGEEFKGLRSQLGIDVPLKRTLEGFIEQATQFYTCSSTTDVKEVDRIKPFIGYTLTNEKALERLKAIEELTRLNEVQAKAMGEAMVARNDRDETTTELRKAWQNFKEYNQNEFRDNEEYLKILSIKPLKKRVGKKEGQTQPPAQENPPVDTVDKKANDNANAGNQNDQAQPPNPNQNPDPAQ
jgi:hypothetical protein